MSIQIGGVVGINVSEFTGDENINYPNPPGSGQFFPNADVSGVELSDSPLIGFRAGHFFYPEKEKSIGVEIDVFYLRPDFDQQTINIKAPGLNIFTNQLELDFHLLVAGLNGLYRFDKIGSVRPYVGLGPSLNLLHVYGSGNSGRTVVGGVIGPEVNGPQVRTTSVGYGAGAKAGISIPLKDNIQIDLEYKFGYNKMFINKLRSQSDIEIDSTAHVFALSLSYKF